jgi:hypothetical protein
VSHVEKEERPFAFFSKLYLVKSGEELPSPVWFPQVFPNYTSHQSSDTN